MVEQEALTKPSPPPSTPNGIHAARVDEKGRLKLPVKFQEYLKGLGDPPLYVTTLDERIARIYPMPEWADVKRKFEEAEGEQFDSAQQLLWMSDLYGDDGALDDQGRVLVPTTLRRKLGIENQPVYVKAFRGHIQILSKELVEQRTANARTGVDEALKAHERAGLR